MLTNILIAVGMSCALGTAFNNANVNNFINNDTPNNVVYDDENYSITLNINELNNYTWVNLGSYFYDNYDSNSNQLSIDISLEYNEIEYIENDSSENSIHETCYIAFYDNDDSYLYFGTDDYSVNNIFLSNNGYQDFEYNLKILVSSADYVNFKNVIELDIQANSSTTPSTQDFISILGDMIGLITGGLTGFATGIGTGVQSLVSSLFIASNGTSLSVFGAVICIFGGIALAIGLSRLIFQWIASIGAKH